MHAEKVSEFLNSPHLRSLHYTHIRVNIVRGERDRDRDIKLCHKTFLYIPLHFTFMHNNKQQGECVAAVKISYIVTFFLQFSSVI